MHGGFTALNVQERNTKVIPKISLCYNFKITLLFICIYVYMYSSTRFPPYSNRITIVNRFASLASYLSIPP
jgi:hypothetical protein